MSDIPDDDELDEFLASIGLPSMDNAPTAKVCLALRHLYATNETAKALFDGLADSKRDRTALKAKVAARRAGLSETAAKALFRQLEKLRVGEYVPGRHGHPSRFVWRFKLRGVVHAARGDDSAQPLELVVGDIENHLETNENEKGGNLPQLPHSYQLRADCKVQFALPKDLTAAEAARLSKFIETLPFS